MLFNHDDITPSATDHIISVCSALGDEHIRWECHQIYPKCMCVMGTSVGQGFCFMMSSGHIRWASIHFVMMHHTRVQQSVIESDNSVGQAFIIWWWCATPEFVAQLRHHHAGVPSWWCDAPEWTHQWSTCFRMGCWTCPLGKHSFRNDAPHQSPAIDHPEPWKWQIRWAINRSACFSMGSWTHPFGKHSFRNDAPHQSPTIDHPEWLRQQLINRSACFSMGSWGHMRWASIHHSMMMHHTRVQKSIIRNHCINLSPKHIMRMCHRIGRRTHSLGKHSSFDDDAPHRRTRTNHNNIISSRMDVLDACILLCIYAYYGNYGNGSTY